MPFAQEAVIYLAAAVIVVPLFNKLGLGAVLGYLVAGLLIGPGILGLIGDVEEVLHFSELGVTLLLFVIGLELQPQRLWQMRRLVFGLGSAQMVLTATVIAIILHQFFGQTWEMSIIVGLGLSLSSTAFALQLLAEKHQTTDRHGRAAFGVLLFQDLAIIPVMATLPVLVGSGQTHDNHAMGTSALRAIIVLAAVAASKFLLRPFLRRIASVRAHEVFSAGALLVVIGIAELVGSVGLSSGLGAFLAGMLMADSEYRHALEADIEPFKGLLLGLFFIAVGMSVNVQLVLAYPLYLAAAVLGLVAIKAGVLYAVSRSVLKSRDASVYLGIVLSQGGEFAFVIFSLALNLTLMQRNLYDFLIATVTLSMVVTPFLFWGYEQIVRPRWFAKHKRTGKQVPMQVETEPETRVIIAGFGRMGQIVGRILTARHIPFTALDTNPEYIDFLKKYGNKVFYGDASRLDILRAAGADQAQVFVLAISSIELSLRCAESVQRNFPNLQIIARARNRDHAYKLRNMGITHVIRETLFSSLKMATETLTNVGLTYSDSKASIEQFLEHDEQLIEKTASFYTDEKRVMQAVQQARAELSRLFEENPQ